MFMYNLFYGPMFNRCLCTTWATDMNNNNNNSSSQTIHTLFQHDCEFLHGESERASEQAESMLLLFSWQTEHACVTVVYRIVLLCSGCLRSDILGTPNVYAKALALLSNHHRHLSVGCWMAPCRMCPCDVFSIHTNNPRTHKSAGSCLLVELWDCRMPRAHPKDSSNRFTVQMKSETWNAKYNKKTHRYTI